MTARLSRSIAKTRGPKQRIALRCLGPRLQRGSLGLSPVGQSLETPIVSTARLSYLCNLKDRLQATMSVFLLLVLFVAQVPDLQFEAPSRLRAVRQRLESIDPAQFDRIVELVGPPVVDMPIRVVLAEEDSPWARGLPRWVAGFAVNSSDTVVIFPARTPVYPNANLEDVLRHEVAHILIHRAAHNAGVPRWFHEGLAMAAEGRWWFGDQSRLLYQFTTGSQTGLDELDRQFTGTEQDQQRAYVLAGALVRDLLQRNGRTTPRD